MMKLKLAILLGLGILTFMSITEAKTCTERGGCTCDCSWANSSTCQHDDGSCCWGCCCTGGGGNKTASTTRYWDCSRPTCSWTNKCTNSGVNIGSGDFAANWNQMANYGGPIYGTVATSGSLGMNDQGGSCGTCYLLKFTNGAAAGKYLTVMSTNYCPDEPNCPRTPEETNPWGQHYHFDIAIPGGGQGLAAKCNQQYGGGFNWKANNRGDCGRLPGGVQQGCNIWWDAFGGMDNPLVEWSIVGCPGQLTGQC